MQLAWQAGVYRQPPALEYMLKQQSGIIKKSYMSDSCLAPTVCTLQQCLQAHAEEWTQRMNSGKYCFRKLKLDTGLSSDW